MENSPQLLPDFTLVYQVIIFFASYFVLNSLVFKPYLALLKLRRDKTIGLKEKAAEAHLLAAKLKQDYESFMTAERKKIAAWNDDERRKVNDEEKQIVQAARDSVTKELDTLHKKIGEEVGRAREQLLTQVPDYSSIIATKLVGRKVDASSLARDVGHIAETSQVFPG